MKFRGSLGGWDLQPYAEERGHSWASSGGQGERRVTRAEAKGVGRPGVSSQRGPQTAEQRTQCAGLARCVSYYKTHRGGWSLPETDHIRGKKKRKKKGHCFVHNIHIQCDLGRTKKKRKPGATGFMRA